MRYNLESALPIAAFSPRCGKGPFSYGMTLEGGGGSWNPVNIVSDAVSSVSDALATIDPGPAIGSVGAQLDQSVRDVIPGGWAMVGAVALTVASMGTIDLEPEVLAGEAGAEVGGGIGGAGAGAAAGEGAAAAGEGAAATGATSTAGADAALAAPSVGSAGAGAGTGMTGTAGLGGATGTGLTTGAGASAGLTGTGATMGGVTGLGGAAGTGLTVGGIGAGTTSALQAMAAAAGTGALTGGALGGVNSAIRGTDPLTGILSGALMGGLTGASLSGVSSLLTANGVSSALAPTMSQALVSVAKGVASGADPITVLENTALSTGLGQLSKAANNLIGPDIGTTASNIATSAGTGALGSAIKGGDPVTGALSGAGGSAINSAYNSLVAPGLSNLGTSSSSPVTASVDPANTILGQQMAQEAQTIGSQASSLEPTIAQQSTALTSDTTAANNLYAQAYTDQTALNNAVSTTYKPAYDNVVSLQNTANNLYSQITPLQDTYNTNKAAYEADRSNTTAFNAANDAATQLNTLIPQYNTAYTAFDTANKSLTDLYNTQVAPLQQSFQASNQALQNQLSQYTTDKAALQNTSGQYGNILAGLNQISQGQLVSGMNAPDVALTAPSASGLSPAELAAISQGQQDAAAAQGTGTQSAANNNVGYLPSTTTPTGSVTVSNDPNEIAKYLPTTNTGSTDTSTSGETGTNTVSNDNTTGETSSTGTTASDIIANLVANGKTPTTNSTATGGLPSTGTSTSPTTSTTSGTGTGTGATAGTGSGSGTTAGTGTGTGTTTTDGSGAGTAVGTGIGAGLVAGLGTGTGTGAGTGTGTGLTNLTGTTSIPNTINPSSTTGLFTPTMVKGTQIASPLANLSIPVENYSAPTYNPNQLQEIQQAATGGIMHKSEGGDVLPEGFFKPWKPIQSRGQQVQGHPTLTGLGGIPLVAKANGGEMSYQDRVLPQEHNPQFFSEGGLNSMQHRYVQGAGDGTSDSIPAMLANGEFVIPADVVSSLGNGSNDSGAKVLDAFLKTIRTHKQKHDSKHLPPDSKGPLAYLLQAKEKVRA